MSERDRFGTGAERRKSYRLSLHEGEAAVRSGDRLIPVTDISATGSSLLVGESIPASLIGASQIVLAGREVFETTLVPVRSRMRGQAWELGTRFFGLDETALGHLFQFYAPRFADQNRWLPERGSEQGTLYTEAAMIPKMIGFHAAPNGASIHVYADALELPLTLCVGGPRADADALSFEVVTGDSSLLETKRAYHFRFAGAGALNEFSAEVIETSATSVTLRRPTQIQQSGYRESRRANVNEYGYVVRLADPRFAREWKTRLFDVAGNGLSITIDPRELGLFPGDELHGIVVSLPERDVTLSGVVRNVMPRGDASWVAGIEVTSFYSLEDSRYWHGRVIDATIGGVLAISNHDPDPSWDVLESSNYLGQWTSPDQRARLRRRYSIGWPDIPPEMGQLMLMRDEQGPYATLAHSLLYPKTWLIHHLGVDQSRRKDRVLFFDTVRRLFATGTQLMMQMSQADYFIFYYEEALRWNAMLYQDFLDRYPDSDQTFIDRFKMFKLRPDLVDQEVLADPRVKVLLETPALLDVFASHVARSMRRCEVEAYAYDRATLTLEDFTQYCRRKSYERSRRIFFAATSEGVVAAIVVETGDDGVNVFGLFNMCRIVSLTADEEVPDWICAALLRRAVRHYGKAGKHEFLYYAHANVDEAKVVREGIQFVSPGNRWVVHRDMVARWLNYLEDTFGSKIVEKKHGLALPPSSKR